MTKHNLTIFSVMGLVAVTATMLPDLAFAQAGSSVSGGGTSVGENLFNDVQELIRGNLGIVAGLGLSLFGLWMWLVQQATWGLLIVIGGAALTAFPGIYGAINTNIKNSFQSSFGEPSLGKTTNSPS